VGNDQRETANASSRALKRRPYSPASPPPSPGDSNVSRSWASRKANAPGTRLLIAQLLALHRQRLSVLFDKTLDVIEDAFEARKIFLVKGVLVEGGPDHYARLEAGKMFMLIVSSRR
jgi:hypothetical protein